MNTNLQGKTLVLRTCPANMIATGTFRDANGATQTYSLQWPRSGPVECPDWDPKPECGHGLHGLAWGNGDWSLLSSATDAVWMVVEVDTDTIVNIDSQKVKFPKGHVVFSGSRVEAVIRVLCGTEAMSQAYREAETWQKENPNYSKAASSGYYSTAASSGNSSKAASSGYYSTAASSGHSSTAASSGDYSKAASSGHSSTAASSGDYSTAEQTGASGIAASIGNNGKAKAGENGLLIVTYWVEAEKRYRACVGNVGEDGIEPDVWYQVIDGKLSKVAP
jgi:hypothetical protein